MKKMLTLCLAGLAAVAFAAEPVVEQIELNLKKNIIPWAPKSYYLTPPEVTVEDGVAKIVCGELAEGAKPSRYQFHVRPKKTFKAGVKYTISFSIKSNMAVAKKQWFVGFMLGQKPYTVYARAEASLKANEKTTITIVCTPKEDITAQTCAPTVQLVLKKGQTLEISDVKITEN